MSKYTSVMNAVTNPICARHDQRGHGHCQQRVPDPILAILPAVDEDPYGHLQEKDERRLEPGRRPDPQRRATDQQQRCRKRGLLVDPASHVVREDRERGHSARRVEGKREVHDVQPQAEGQRHEKHVEQVRIALDTVARVEDEALPVDEVPGVAEGDVCVVRTVHLAHEIAGRGATQRGVQTAGREQASENHVRGDHPGRRAAGGFVRLHPVSPVTRLRLGRQEVDPGAAPARWTARARGREARWDPPSPAVFTGARSE